MLVGVAIVFGKLVALPPAPYSAMVPVVKTNPRAGITAVLDIVFTYGGQVHYRSLSTAHTACFALHHDMVPVVKSNPGAGVTAVLDIVYLCRPGSH